VPNTQLTTTAIINRTIRDPRRSVTASVPVRLGVSLERARSVVLEGLRSAPGAERLDGRVTIGEISEKVVWLTATAFAPLDADVAKIGSDMRERALTALGDAGFLPA
jgi:small-conductance mechanosensitive channel